MGGRFAIAATLCAAAVVAGCGSGNSSSGGNGSGGSASRASESVSQIEQDLKSAISSEHSVHIAGTVTGSGTGSITIDLVVVKPNGLSGTFAYQGFGHIQVVTADNSTFYVTGDDAFWAHFDPNAAEAQLLAGKCLIVDQSETGFASLVQGVNEIASILSPDLNGALSNTSGVTKGSVTTVGGQQVVPLRTSDGSALYIPTHGSALPARLTRSGTNGGDVTFSQWNATSSIATPTGCVSPQSLVGGAGSPSPAA